MILTNALRALGLSATIAVLPLAALADQIRLLAFGDSLTEGYGLKARDGLVPQLQSWLRDRGHDVVVLNGGLSGDTTAGGRVRIGYSIARHKPDAILVELGGNDLIAGLGWRGAEDNLDSILSQAGKGAAPLLLVGIANPRAQGDDRADWAAIWPRLAQRHGTLLHADLYAPLVQRPQAEWADLLQADGVHASAAGVRLIVEGLGPQVEALLAQVTARRLAAQEIAD